MQVGKASLGWSVVKDKGMRSCILGARLGLGDTQHAALGLNIRQGQQEAAGAAWKQGAAGCQCWVEEGVLGPSLAAALPKNTQRKQGDVQVPKSL